MCVCLCVCVCVCVCEREREREREREDPTPSGLLTILPRSCKTIAERGSTLRLETAENHSASMCNQCPV